MKLHGRYGAYEARTPAELKKARKLAQEQRALQARIADFKDRHRECKNGCGKPPAWFAGGHALEHEGCCSEACLRKWNAKQDFAQKGQA